MPLTSKETIIDKVHLTYMGATELLDMINGKTSSSGNVAMGGYGGSIGMGMGMGNMSGLSGMSGTGSYSSGMNSGLTGSSSNYSSLSGRSW